MTKLRELKLDDEILGSDAPILSETFETVSKGLKSHPYEITYDGDNIDFITYDLDGLTIVKTFNYTDGKLTSIVLSGDTPTGIELTKTFTYTGEQLISITYS
jgi:hypothetical protein